MLVESTRASRACPAPLSWTHRHCQRCGRLGFSLTNSASSLQQCLKRERTEHEPSEYLRWKTSSLFSSWTTCLPFRPRAVSQPQHAERLSLDLLGLWTLSRRLSGALGRWKTGQGPGQACISGKSLLTGLNRKRCDWGRGDPKAAVIQSRSNKRLN